MSPDDIPLETEDEFRARMRSVEAGGAQLRRHGDPDRGDHAATGLDQQEGSAASARRGRYGPLLLLLAVLVAIGIEVGATAVQHYSAVKQSDWKRAAVALATLRKTRDPILVAPHWAEPVAYRFLAKQIDVALASLSDVDRFEHVWELSIRSARHPWLRNLQQARSWSFGPVTLSRYDKKAERVLYDFRQHLASAKVTVAPGHDCQARGRYYTCDRCDPNRNPNCWNWVGPHLAEVQHRPYSCIYAHPVQGRRLRLDYANVPLGTRLIGYTGIDDFDKRKRAKGPVRMQIFIDHKLVRDIVHQNDWPWTRFSARSQVQPGSRHHVRFEVTTQAGFERAFCFHAEARR